VHFKHEQPQVLSPDSHVTIGTIQQTEEAANVLWVYRLTQGSHCCFFHPYLFFFECIWLFRLNYEKSR